MRVAALALSAFVAGGCTAGDGDADAGPEDAPDAGGSPDAGVLDVTRDPSCPTTVPWLVEARGAVLDEAGAPVADAIAQMCVRTNGGLLLCLQPTPTSASGAFHIVVSANARCAERATLRVLVPQQDFGTLYCDVPLSPTEPSLVLEAPYVMVATTQPSARPPLGDASVTRTVTFAEGLALDVTPSALLFPDDYERLAARALAANAAPACVLEAAPAFAGVLAFSPEAELRDTSFALRIPHGGALSEGQSVELWLLGGLSTKLADGTRVPEGVWQRFGTGTVSGALIDVPAAEGIPSFNWLGWRAAD